MQAPSSRAVSYTGRMQAPGQKNRKKQECKKQIFEPKFVEQFDVTSRCVFFRDALTTLDIPYQNPARKAKGMLNVHMFACLMFTANQRLICSLMQVRVTHEWTSCVNSDGPRLTV